METEMISIKSFPYFLFLFIIILVGSCIVEPQPIDFGADQCFSCKMMIADQRFGGELVSNKGKIQKFDAMECLIEYVKKNDEEDFKYILSVNFAQPRELINAKTAYYYIDPEIPSPMGANLSVYESPNDIHVATQNSQGKIMNWDEIKKEIQR
jgi:copper chaperone NosL